MHKKIFLSPAKEEEERNVHQFPTYPVPPIHTERVCVMPRKMDIYSICLLLLLLQHVVCVNTETDNSGFHDGTSRDVLHHASCVDEGRG